MRSNDFRKLPERLRHCLLYVLKEKLDALGLIFFLFCVLAGRVSICRFLQIIVICARRFGWHPISLTNGSVHDHFPFIMK